ncbi:hypothetical protein WA158_004188 [Blastocystis sp. Blastoise]
MSRPMNQMPIQDMPPKGGYKIWVPKRYLPQRVGGGLLLGIIASGMAFGWYRYSLSVKAKRAMNQERFESRLAITPFLQAEEDIRFCEASDKSDAKEEKIMENVPGWVVGKSVYNTRWMAPAELK